jgi:hypothetical protein
MTRLRSAAGGPPRGWLRRSLIAFVVASFAWSGTVPSHAAPLNLHGVVELTGRWSRWDHQVLNTDLPPEETTGLQQHYQLSSSGLVYHPNVGSYVASASLVDDVSRLNSEKSQDLKVKDFYLAFTMLPRKAPLALYAQRTTQDNDAFRPDTYGPVTTNSTYNLTWDFPIQRQSRLRLNLSQTDLQTEARIGAVTTSSGQTTRAAALDADGQTGMTHYFARYQISEMGGTFDEATSHTITASADTRFTPALSGAARLNYSSSVNTLGVVTPGLGTLQQRSAGASVFYRPSLDTSFTGTYDFYKDPFVRHLALGSASLRPRQDMDVTAGYRLSRFDVPDALTTSHYAYATANYRPFFGLTTNLNAALGVTEVTGATNVRSVYQNYGAGANYLKTLTLIIYRLGYQGNYSENELSPAGGSSRDLTNVFTAGISNTQTRLVALSGDYALSLIQHHTDGAESADQIDHRFQVTANSSAPQNLFLPGDFMVISGFASYAVTQYRAFTNHIVLVNVSDTYETGRGVAATVGVTYEQQSQLAYDNKTTSFIQVRWLSYIVRNGSLDMTAKQSWERYAGNQQDVTRSEGGALFSYYLGKVTLTADYRMVYETRPSDQQLMQAGFLRVSRPF